MCQVYVVGDVASGGIDFWKQVEKVKYMYCQHRYVIEKTPLKDKWILRLSHIFKAVTGDTVTYSEQRVENPFHTILTCGQLSSVAREFVPTHFVLTDIVLTQLVLTHLKCSVDY